MKVFVVLAFWILSLNATAQKAFEFEYYYGKTHHFEIKLSLANGYILASEILETNLATRKKTKYIPTGSSGKTLNLVFLPDTTAASIKRRKRNKIILYNLKEDYESLPAKIKGIYGIDLKTFSFKLYKQKAIH